MIERHRNGHFKEERDLLQNTACVASALCQKLAELNVPISQYPLPPDIDSLIPNLVLSVPPDVLKPLMTLEISEDIRQALLQRLNRFIDELEQQYKSTYRQACLQTFRGTNSTSDIHSLHRAYQALLERHFLPSIRDQVAFILAEVARRQQPLGEHKRSFNSEFTPILEKYFEYNGYPSIAHRSILAQKSTMIPRQIEVWFQNHRNRAKKEGKPIPRLNSDIPLKRALSAWKVDKLPYQNRLPTPTRDEWPGKSGAEQILALKPIAPMKALSAEHNEELSSKLANFLDDSYKPRPPHAFPATRHAQCPNPFPTNDGVFKFAPPPWRRKPATLPITDLAVDMDEFSQLFHLKLNFAENSRRRGSTPLDSFPSRPWFTATTTIPSSAPCPSLVRILNNIPLPTGHALLGPSTYLPTIGSTSLFSFSTPLPFPGENPVRKMRPLPRRIPPRLSSNSFGSRTSSFSSDTSSGSGSSPDLSNYSSSPELSTPPPLPDLDLPVLLQGGQQEDLFDFSHTELDINYPLSNLLPSQDFSPANLYSGSNKFTDTPFFDNVFLNFGHNLGDILS